MKKGALKNKKGQIKTRYRTWRNINTFVGNMKASVYRKICKAVDYVDDWIELEDGYIDGVIHDLRKNLIKDVAEKHVRELRVVREHLDELMELAVDLKKKETCWRKHVTPYRCSRLQCVYCRVPRLLRMYALTYLREKNEKNEKGKNKKEEIKKEVEKE